MGVCEYTVHDNSREQAAHTGSRDAAEKRQAMRIAVLCISVIAACLPTGDAMAQDITIETESFAWTLSEDGYTRRLVDKSTGRDVCVQQAPAFGLVTAAGTFEPERVQLAGEVLTVEFAEGSGQVRFNVAPGPRHVLLRLADLQTAEPFERLMLCRLFVPRSGTIAGLLNAWRGPKTSVAVMGLSPWVRPGQGRGATGAGGSASAGATPKAIFTPEAKVGQGAAHLFGRNPTDKVAWTFWPHILERPLDLRGHAGIGAWVKGDGKGELLKIQLHDGSTEMGHYRDYYITIDFTGWRYFELPRPEGEAIDYTHIKNCNLYFNSIPANTNVECVVDDIRALKELTGEPSESPWDWVLEDFESPARPYFDVNATVLSADCLATYGTEGAGVAVAACPSDELAPVIEEVELAAGLPSPHFDGVWAKRSEDVKRSYLFIQGLSVDNVDEVIGYARRGGFSAILIGQGCWTTSLGHFPINQNSFPKGIEDLRETVSKIHAAGFRCGLHFLAAAVSAHDPYVTPVPDDRLVMDFFGELGGDVTADGAFIPAAAAPSQFPPKEGGYRGNSAILRVGDELIGYGSVSLQEPYGFNDCRRGLYGTKAVAHRAWAQISHVKRSYGYFLHGIDEGLTDEVAGHLARVAKGAGVDMLYFDGSEGLQGGQHWHYNARLHKAYWDAMGRPNDMLLQASSVSHYSFHMLSRQASADGVEDLKGYLDHRLPSFKWYSNNLLPLDLGWYGIWSARTTPDQIEYINQKALGFGCSVSIQTNPTMLRGHSRMDEFIDIIRSYEDLRLAGTVSEPMRARLRVPGQEYMLSTQEGAATFRRVQWTQELAMPTDGQEGRIALKIDPALGTARLGLEMRAGALVLPGPSYHDPDNWLLEDFEDLEPYGGEHRTGTNLAGSTREGVTQKLTLVAEGAKLGDRCAMYSATSTRSDGGGWSAIGKKLALPLDLRQHVALGVWVHGDNSGAKLKIQPRGKKGRAQDYYITINFSGWRYYVLMRPETPSPEPIEYDAVTWLTFYYNGLPAGKTCTVLIDGLKALRRVDEVRTVLPTVSLGDTSLSFDAELGQGESLLYRGGAQGTVKSRDNNSRAALVKGGLGELPPGEGELVATFPGPGEQKREVFVRAFVLYD